MNANPMFQSNPLLGRWLSAANSAAGAWGGFWTAEFARQQATMLTEWNRQALRFWTGAWAAPLLQAQAPARQAATQPAPVPAPALAEMAEPVALPAAPAAPVPVPASVAPAVPAEPEKPTPVLKPKKGAVQLRAATPHRKAAKPATRGSRRDRITRH